MKKSLIGLILLFVFSISIFGVSYASKSRFDVSTGIIGDSNGSASADSWGYSRNRCGTRYVLEIDDSEVGGGKHLDYYVNHIITNNNTTRIYMGTNYTYSSNFYSGSLDYNGFYTVPGLPSSPSGASASYWFTNWLTANPSSSNFNPGSESIEFERIKFVAGCILSAANDAGDSSTASQMQDLINGSLGAKIAIKAEILFYVFPPKALTGNTRKSLFLTYNEVRAYADDGNHRGGIRYMRGGGNVSWYKADGGSLDMIATKLYEMDQEYALKGGRVNCKCNMLTSKYGYSATLDGKFLKFSGGSLSSWDSSIGGVNVADAILPNMCSVKAGGSYYSMGLRKGGSNDPVSSDFYVDGKSAKGTHMQAECKGWDFMNEHNMVKGSSAITNKAFIFEGWDYLWWGQKKVEKGSVYANWLVKKGNQYTAIPNISRYENKNLDFGTYKVSYTEGGRSFTNYTYKGYCVQDGNVSASSASVGSLYNSWTAQAAISASAKEKTIHFVFEEITGTIKVRTVLITNGNAATLLEPNNTSYNYTKNNVSMGTQKVNLYKYNKDTYKYVGYRIVEGKIDNTTYNLDSRFTAGESASVTLTPSKKEYVITFVYIDNSFAPLGVSLEVLHFNTTDNEYIPIPKTITANWNDISVLLQDIYSKASNKDEAIKTYNKIMSNTNLSLNQKVSQALELAKSGWTNNEVIGLRSFVLKSPEMKMYRLLPEESMMDIKNKTSNKIHIGSVEVGDKKQHIPNYNDVKSLVDNDSFVLTNSDKITITIYYVCDRIVIFEHYDYFNQTHKLREDYIPEPVVKGSDIRYDGPDNISGYKYYPEKTVPGPNTPIKENDINHILVGPVNVNKEKVKLYYVKTKKVDVVHVDKNNTNDVLDQDSPSIDLVFGAEVDAKARIDGARLEDAIGGKVFENLRGNDSYYRYEGEDSDYSVDPTAAFKVPTLYGNKIVKVKNDGTYSDNKVTVKFLYQKYWPIEVHFIDIETNLDIVGEDGNTFTKYKEDKDGTINHREDAEKIPHYKYLKNENNEETYYTKNINGKTYFYFYYIKKPTISGDIIMPPDLPLPEDPSDPSSPYNPSGPYYGKKIIVLDDIFGMNYNIDNYNRLEYDAEVRITFPFDVYYNNEFKSANIPFMIATYIIPKLADGSADKDNMPVELKNEKVYFRLPSWIIEKDYPEECNLELRYINPPLGEDDPLSEQKHSITVIGTLYDFTITQIEEGVSQNQAKWTTSLFGNLGYANGNNFNNEYKADTLPIGQNHVTSNVSTYKVNNNFTTQNPVWGHGISVGTPFLFSINTKGLLSNKISIEPKLEYYNLNGVKQNNVIFKYITLAGESDFTNRDGIVVGNNSSFVTTLNKPLRYTTEVQNEVKRAIELKNRGVGVNLLGSAKKTFANVINAYSSFSHINEVKFGSYNRLLIPNTLRLPFANYANTIADSNYAFRYSEVQRIGNVFANDDYSNMSGISSVQLNYVDDSISKYVTDKLVGQAEMDNDALINSLGHWYAEYSLPTTLVAKDASGKTLNNGFIVLKFKIRTMRDAMTPSEIGEQEYLTYWRGKDNNNNYLLSQWTSENKNLKYDDTSKEDCSKTEININFPIIDGTTSSKVGKVDISDGYYPVAIFESGFSINDFYTAVGTH